MNAKEARKASKTNYDEKLLKETKTLYSIIEQNIRNAIENGLFETTISAEPYLSATVIKIKEQLEKNDYGIVISSKTIIISW